MDIDISAVSAIAVHAGQAILEVYTQEFGVEYKEDHSPLTDADRASHALIAGALRSLTPEIPILSEEGRNIPYEERKSWDRFWCVDPLDGTKEFVKRNGEFTVNIALVEKDHSVAGVIYIPVQDRLFYGIVGEGAWRRNGNGRTVPIHVRDVPEDDGLIVVQSRSHPSGELQDFLAKLNVKDSIAKGSSLKFCAVADGSADIYPRMGPTCEWDTAAGQAIVEAAGGHVVDRNGRPLRYNKKIIKNSSFIVVADLSLLP